MTAAENRATMGHRVGLPKPYPCRHSRARGNPKEPAMHRDDPKRLADARFSDRVIRAPRGSKLTAKNWLTEAPLRMLMNNLDPEVAERPHELVVYGGIGRAARNWACFDAIVKALTGLEDDESLLI